MTHEEFEKVLTDVQSRTRQVLAAKSSEYSSGGDRFHNFKAASDTYGRSRLLYFFFLLKACVYPMRIRYQSYLTTSRTTLTPPKTNVSGAGMKTGCGLNTIQLTEF